MKLHHASNVHIILPKAALAVIFDECDRYDHDETGGRIVGTYREHGGKLTIEVLGIIEPGPNATRSPVVLFQDGEYQEQAFRKIEEKNPTIEHLGTWHTHHVNGLQTLSGGDITTYSKTVNHHKHNTDFFYALLVVAKHKSKKPLERYTFKHFIFRRDDDRFYEIEPRHVDIVDAPLVWPITPPTEASGSGGSKHHADTAYRSASELATAAAAPQLERVYDRDILAEFYQHVKPFKSAKLGIYWRGPVELLDGSKIEVVLIEDSSEGAFGYSLMLRDAPKLLKDVAGELAKQVFVSARVALISAERQCNRAIFEQHRSAHKSDKH